MVLLTFRGYPPRTGLCRNTRTVLLSLGMNMKLKDQETGNPPLRHSCRTSNRNPVLPRRGVVSALHRIRLATGTPQNFAVILTEHKCNTPRDFNVKSTRFLQIFVPLTSPAFCRMSLNSTSYRIMRRGPR